MDSGTVSQLVSDHGLAIALVCAAVVALFAVGGFIGGLGWWLAKRLARNLDTMTELQAASQVTQARIETTLGGMGATLSGVNASVNGVNASVGRFEALLARAECRAPYTMNHRRPPESGAG